jgi:hypothetical protein
LGGAKNAAGGVYIEEREFGDFAWWLPLVVSHLLVTSEAIQFV